MNFEEITLILTYDIEANGKYSYDHVIAVMKFS